MNEKVSKSDEEVKEEREKNKGLEETVTDMEVNITNLN